MELFTGVHEQEASTSNQCTVFTPYTLTLTVLTHVVHSCL